MTLIKGALITGIVILAASLGMYFRNQNAKAEAYAITTIGWTIGKDLVAKKNSPMLQMGPLLRQPLDTFLTSPANVQAVELGDDPQQNLPGWREAKARLYLTNERQERLEIRIGKPAGITNFVALGMHTEKIDARH